MSWEDWEYEVKGGGHWRARDSRKSHNRSAKKAVSGNMKMDHDGDLTMVDPYEREKKKSPRAPRAPRPAKKSTAGEHRLTETIPRQFAGHIIGTKGNKINAMKAKHGVNISLSNNSETTTVVHIWGPALQVEMAWHEIWSIVTGRELAETKRSKKKAK